MISPYQFTEAHGLETPQFDLWLFHETRHLILQDPAGWRTFVIKKKEQVVAQVRFHIKDARAQTSLKSPFGTFQFTQNLPAEVLFSFIQFTEDELKKSGVQEITIKNPPARYAPFQHELLTVSLLNLGYRISLAEIGSVIEITGRFENNLDTWELRKLKQAADSGLRIVQGDMHQLAEVYAFIDACRKERGHNLSMTMKELEKVVTVFPDRFFLHLVKDNDRLAAASISIKINNSILYNFYSAHPKEYDHLSPAVLLMQSLYSFCLGNKMELLDLGTSAINGIPNFGLLDFKFRLGGQPTAKNTFQKELQ